MPRPDADAHLVERVLREHTLLRGNFLELRRDEVALPDGRSATREYMLHPGAVVVVPLLDDGRVVVERQFRYPVGRVMLEFPAGKIDAGEDLQGCAARELREETGYTAREWAYAAPIHNAAAYSNEVIHLYFARGLAAGPPQLDAGEFIETVAMAEQELEALAAAGELTDVKTLIGLQWLQRWRTGHRVLQWLAV